MSIENLVVTVNNQNPDRLFESMHLECDSVIANQCDSYSSAKKALNGCNVRVFNTETSGVGINRNIAMIESTGDICILSDDDMVYVNGYSRIVKRAFKEMPDADVIIFNIETIGDKKDRRKNESVKRVRKYNFMNYGAARIAFKKDSISKNNIWFSPLFGGGAKYSSGEDTLFLNDCIKKHLKVYTYPETIATADQTSSTWFSGYNEKFFFDKGALIGQIFPFLKYLFIFVYFPLRFKSDLTYKEKTALLYSGNRMYEEGTSFKQWKNDKKRMSDEK